jgi:hypothetical protein
MLRRPAYSEDLRVLLADADDEMLDEILEAAESLDEIASAVRTVMRVECHAETATSAHASVVHGILRRRQRRGNVPGRYHPQRD